MRAFASLLILAPLALPQESGAEVPCRVHGRLVDVHGDPVPGASVSVHGWGANSQRVQRYGAPRNWNDPDPVESAEDGSFELSFIPPPAYQFVVDVKHADYGKVGWRWSELAFGADEDLGEVILETPGVLIGHIVDTAGNLLVEGWYVSANHSWSRQGPRSSQTSNIPVDPTTGTFRIDDLPPGRIRLSASSQGGTHIRELWVESTSDEITEVEMVYEGPDPSTRLVVSISSRPFYPFRPEQGSVHAIDASGKRTPLEPAPGRANNWHALGLESGAYTVEIQDPRFQPWRMEGVHTGRTERARLVGSAAIRVTVRSPESQDEIVGAYGLRVTYSGVNFSPNRFTVAEDGAQAPKDGLFEGIVPGDLELEVRAPGEPPQFLAVPDLEPGETREVSLTLEVARSLTGRVVHADGRPAAGIPVQVTRGDIAGHDLGPGTTVSTSGMGPDGESRSVQIRYRDAESVTDVDGRFAFPELSTGSYTLRAVPSPWVSVDAAAAVGGNEAEPCLILPELGGADITLLLDEGTSREGIKVDVAPDPSMGYVQYGRPQAGRSLDDLGRCQLEGIPVGEHELRMSVEMKTDNSTSFHYVALGKILVEAGSRASKTFDVRRTKPVLVTIEASFDGPAPGKFNARLDTATEDGRPPQGLASTNMFDSVRSMHTAPPGRYYVRIACAPGGWRWTRPEVLEVRPGKDITVKLTVPLVERSVHFVDGEGRALPETELTWFNDELLDDIQRFSWAGGPRWNDALAKTDSSGSIRKLALPAGTYFFAHAGANKGDNVEVSWEAGEGALEIVLPDLR